MTRRMLYVPWTLTFIFLLATGAGCKSCKDGGDSERDEIKLQLDWKPGAEHAFLYAGKAAGYFADEGISVSIIPGTGSSASANMVDAKSVDFALCSGETALQARSAETPRQVSILAVFYPNTPTVIYSLKAKGITKPQDLYGKRLGILKGSSAYRNYEAFAKKIGIERSRITEIPSTGDLREIIGDDAPLDAMVHFGFQHPLQLRLQGKEVSVIRLRDYGIKIYGQGLITHNDTLKTRPKLVRKLVRAVQRSYQHAMKNPQGTLQIFVKEVPAQDEKYSAKKLAWVNDFVRSGIPAGKPIGYHDYAGWIATRDYLKEQGLLSTAVKLEMVWTASFLDPSVTPPAE